MVAKSLELLLKALGLRNALVIFGTAMNAQTPIRKELAVPCSV